MLAQQSTALPTNNIETLKSQLLNLSPATFEALKNTYYYRWIASLLRVNGRVNLVLGGLTMWLALSNGANLNPYRVVQSLLGILIVAQSLWSLLAPSRIAILTFALVILLAGIWNLFISINDLGSDLALLLIILGIFQLSGAFQFYKIYNRFSPTLTKPTPETDTLYDQLWQRIISLQPNEDINFVEIKMGRSIWQGFLLRDIAVLAYPKKKMVIFAQKSGLLFTPKIVERVNNTQVNGRMKLVTVTSRATFLQASFNKYAQWFASSDKITTS